PQLANCLSALFQTPVFPDNSRQCRQQPSRKDSVSCVTKKCETVCPSLSSPRKQNSRAAATYPKYCHQPHRPTGEVPIMPISSAFLILISASFGADPATVEP